MNSSGWTDRHKMADKNSNTDIYIVCSVTNYDIQIEKELHPFLFHWLFSFDNLGIDVRN